jgi:hypothetical protein
MSSVSEFIGFIVISIFPTQAQKGPRIRQPFHINKSSDALIPGDEESIDGLISGDDTIPRPRGQRAHDNSTPNIVHHIKASESANHSALAKPDFWMMALIMAMRSFLSSVD